MIATARPAPRSVLRSVAVPVEHGGWGLSIEPGLLGLAVAPSWAGLALAAAAVAVFLARTPARAVAVGRHRGRHGRREQVAARVAAGEGLVLVALVGVAAATGRSGWWWPIPVAAIPAAVAARDEVRSRGRRLAPELAGAVAMAAAAPVVALAGGAEAALAVGLWLVLAARTTTAIPHVRAQVARLHGRPPASTLSFDLGALALVGGAVALDPALLAGAAAVAAVITLQRALARRPVPKVAVLGVRQLLLGLAVVVATAAGVALA